MKEPLREVGRAAVRRLARVSGLEAELYRLHGRISALEDEVQECRQLNLRLAELTDVVGELLLPVAQRDEARIAEAVERYSKGL